MTEQEIVEQIQAEAIATGASICLMGHTASGKTSLAAKLNLPVVKLYSSRPRRNSLDNEYIFITNNDVSTIPNVLWRKYDVIENGKPAVWYYGIPITATADILIIDPVAYQQIQLYKPTIGVLLIERYEELKRRSKLRGDEEAEFNRRIEQDELYLKGIRGKVAYIRGPGPQHQWEISRD